MTKGLKRFLISASVLALTLGAWFLFGPHQLGGPASYSIVAGSSMEPGLAADDLVIVRDSGDYGPGDVVAYHNEQLGQIVLHRIVRRDGDRFVLKGDRNDWLDSDRPYETEVLGRQWVTIPGAGPWLLRLREPRTAALLIGTLTILVLSRGGNKTRNDRGTSQPELT